MENATNKNIDGSWYINEQLDFDKKMVGYRYQAIRPYIKQSHALELGSADGQMTRFLVQDFAQVTTVDGSKELLDRIPDTMNLTKIHSYFEDLTPSQKFDTIVLEHILEHVNDPVSLLKLARQWLAPGGVMLMGVPNALSFHRLAAVKMGMLQSPYQLNERDHQVGHQRVYDMDTFQSDIRSAGLTISLTGGVFLKPLSNKQIENNWTDEMIAGFYELGKDFPRHAAEIYAVCEI
ncbi:MAG: class I SAM-dependent methyltransferase [Alphaproteobacteria bacterium]|jgi:2-polyprenyl-3-methyl-5-hydroxy-6-metoxy-1,4-benzoquinol methylase